MCYNTCNLGSSNCREQGLSSEKILTRISFSFFFFTDTTTVFLFISLNVVVPLH